MTLTELQDSMAAAPDAPARHRASSVRSALVLLLVAALFGGGLWWVMTGGPTSFFEGCESTADDRSVGLDLEQAEVAATIASVAERRQIPARGVSIALAAGLQESKLRNLDYGDRDSLGVFQQRPSQGWGAPRQVMNPTYAAERFFDGLLQVPQWQGITINDAAQAVQRSGFPDHYAKHEPAARSVASALTGYSPASFTCVVQHGPMAVQEVGALDLTPRAAAVARQAERRLGSPVVSGAVAMPDTAPMTWGPDAEGATSEGRAVLVTPAGSGAEQVRHGWVIAHWLVANADRAGIETVSYDGFTWQADRSRHGWESHPQGSGPGAVRLAVVRGS